MITASKGNTEAFPTNWTVGSWSMFFLWYQIMTAMFDSYYMYFYNVNLKLPVIWITGVIWISTIWGAVNEPLIGYFSEINLPVTRKIGKRRPWAIVGACLAILGFVLYYTPVSGTPIINPLPVAIWMCIMMCVYNTGLTLADVNVQSLFPDKFRSTKARHKVQSWVTPISLTALVIAQILPSQLLLNKNDVSQYTKFTLFAGIILVVTFIGSFYGLKEDKEVIDRYYYTKKENKENFLKTVKNCFRQKAFVMMVLMLLAYGVVIGTMLASVPYMFTYLIRGSESYTIVATAGLVSAGIFTSPLWAKLFAKLNDNKKSFAIAGVIFAISTMLIGFSKNIATGLIFVTLYGGTMAAFWMLNPIILADVYDERAVLYKTTERGAAVGIMQFMTRLSRLVMSTMIAIIYTVTGFDPSLTEQTDRALMGVRLQAGIIPGLLFLIVLLIWIKYYPLNKERTLEIREELKKMKL